MSSFLSANALFFHLNIVNHNLRAFVLLGFVTAFHQPQPTFNLNLPSTTACALLFCWVSSLRSINRNLRSTSIYLQQQPARFCFVGFRHCVPSTATYVQPRSIFNYSLRAFVLLGFVTAFHQPQPTFNLDLSSTTACALLFCWVSSLRSINRNLRSTSIYLQLQPARFCFVGFRHCVPSTATYVQPQSARLRIKSDRLSYGNRTQGLHGYDRIEFLKG